jgi:transcriptional regulator with XRE-family HTH domain
MTGKDTNKQRIILRTKRLGILIKDARLADRRTLKECAKSIGVTEKHFESYENGSEAPSLPELEALAYFLGFPINHFWGNQLLSDRSTPEFLMQLDEIRSTREKEIGLIIKEEREKQNLSLREVSERSSISREKWSKIEDGETALSIPELEIICNSLALRFENVFDKNGPVGKWQQQQESIKHFLELNPEMQNFISLPINHPFIELATRLSSLSVEKLRLIAESLLEITY